MNENILINILYDYTLQSIMHQKFWWVPRVRLYKTLITPVLCYGSETWTLRQMTEQGCVHLNIEY
jgi:hypothetical protein